MAEKLTIDGVDFPIEWAWDVLNLWVLWRGPATRGNDRRLPGVPGVKPYRRRATVSKRTLELVVFGFRDPTGAPYADVREGLEANLDFLRANVTDPTNIGDGTRTAVLELPSGATRTGPIHIEDFDVAGLGPTSVKATMDISLPEGALT